MPCTAEVFRLEMQPRPSHLENRLMKRLMSVLIGLGLFIGLAACGNSPEYFPVSSPPSERAIPDVSGLSYGAAVRVLRASRFTAIVVGSDGERWEEETPTGTVVMSGTNPAIGTVTDAEEIELLVEVTEGEYADAVAAHLKAQELKMRYEFTCVAGSNELGIYRTLEQVWSSPHYNDTSKCTVKIGRLGIYDKPTLNSEEQKIADVVASYGGGGGGSPSSDYGRVVELCIKVDADYVDRIIARMDWKKAEAHGALALCPDAPHVAVLQEVASAVKMGDGTYVVGQTLEPGTYRTRANIKDCYWSRNTGSGAIIANDFVSFAPNGATVTVYEGEGFESNRCGVWTKIG